jgi:dipeptidyl aminopeptidase/acylaminoacyl peptidase
MKRRHRQWGGILLVAIAAASDGATSKAAGESVLGALPVEAVLKVRNFAELIPIATSPDGHWLAYTTQDKDRARPADAEAYFRSGVNAQFTGTDIWIQNVRTGEVKNLTEGKGDNWLPVWSPDGNCLAFLSDRDSNGQARLWVWNLPKNQGGQVSDMNLRAHEIEWLPNSKEIIVATAPQQPSVDVDRGPRISNRGTLASNADETQDPTVLVYKGSKIAEEDEKGPISDPWNLDDHLRDLVSVNIGSGKVTSIVQGKRISAYSLSPDGSHVAYTSPERFERPGSQQILFDLAVAELSTNQGRVIASHVRLDLDGGAFSWSPDGKWIGFHTGGMEERVYDCYAVNINDGVSRNVTMFSPLEHAVGHNSAAPVWDRNANTLYVVHNGAAWRATTGQSKAEIIGPINDRQITQIISSTGNLLWTPDGAESAIVVVHDNRRKQDGIYKMDLATGQSMALLESGQCYTCANALQHFTVTGDGKYLAYIAEDSQHDEDLWISDATFQSPSRLTHLNQQFDKYRMGSARLLDWLSDDGDRLQGALLLPSNYEAGVRYPLIVWVYGGNSMSDRLDHFGLVSSGLFNMQLFATRGYAVLLPDAPLHLGTPMFDLAKTVLPGVNKAIELGIADPNRLGVMGQSFGGYSTLGLIVQTDRFKAAVEVDGFGNLLGHYGEMDKSGTAFGTSIEERGQGLMGGTPWQFRARYTENSPTFYLDKLNTPLLIVQGSSDTAVPPFLGDELFVELRRLGQEVQYAKYEGEGHSPGNWSYPHQLNLCNRLLSWFDMYLKQGHAVGE